MYFLRDDSTESVSNINAAKYFVTQDSALSVFTSDANGLPNSALSGKTVLC